MAKIAASILAADLLRLEQELDRVRSADMIHVDVMDGAFVPNISFGHNAVAAARRACPLPIVAHLMVERPENHVEWFAEAGADFITVHAEATTHLHRVLGQIKSLGSKAGVALNPSTPHTEIEYVIDLVDLVLVMTVNPGFGGQEFIPAMLPKITAISEMARDRGIYIEVDGGISHLTAPAAVAAGANVLVAGTYIFGAPDASLAISSLRKAGLV